LVLASSSLGWLYDGLHHHEAVFWLCSCAFLLVAIVLALAPRPGERHAGSTQARAVTDEDMVESSG